MLVSSTWLKSDNSIIIYNYKDYRKIRRPELEKRGGQGRLTVSSARLYVININKIKEEECIHTENNLIFSQRLKQTFH